MNNHDEHRTRVGKYNPRTVEEALDIIYGLQPSNFNMRESEKQKWNI